jgi:polysaccharide export outer membrane protein
MRASRLSSHREARRAVAIFCLLLVAILLVPSTGLRAQDYTARRGDVIDILVVGEPDLSRLVTVSEEGNIFIPLIGNLHVEGRSIREIEQRLKAALSRFLKDPQVLVTFRQTNGEKDFVYVLGQVTRPGPYEHRRAWTVAELLAMAGGPTVRAALRRAVIIRRSQAIPINLQKLVDGDVAENKDLVPGDVLVVPEISERERVLVLGEVARPGYQDIKEGDRVIDIITRAGGPTVKGAPEDVAVLRNGNTGRVNLEIFLRDGNMDHNPIVEAGDVINVPETDRRVLVIGEVAKPGPVTLNARTPTRALDAITQVGGPNRGSNMSQVTIVRYNGKEPKGIVVNLHSVVRGGPPDQNIVLQAGDVVYVPAGFGIQLRSVTEIIGSLTGFNLLRTLLGLP